MAVHLSGTIGADHYRATIHTARHVFHADEPVSNGGADTAPSPGEILLSALAACKLITTRMYADRKGWAVGAISAELEMTVDSSQQPVRTQIECRLSFEGELDTEQLERLVLIADKCPTHRILTGEVSIHSALKS